MTTLHHANKADRLAARYIPDHAVCVFAHDNGSACYTYERGGRPYALAYQGTSSRSVLHGWYSSEDRRQAQIAAFKDSIEGEIRRKAQRQADKAAWVNPLRIGDVLYTSWGYDQTNTEFFIVTRLSGRRVWVRQIAADYEEDGFMSGRTWPAMPIRYTGPETMHTGPA